MENNRDKVLYIDDEEVNLILFEATFSKDYAISIALSTREAERMMSDNDFKVIISDISMPNETGLEFFNRQHSSEINPIFIILTAHISNSLLLEALNQGRIYRYITKPWNYEEVRFTIDNAIQLYNLHYQNHILFEQIRQSQQNFQNIFQSSQDGVVIFNPEHNILQANRSFSGSMGVIGLIGEGIKLSDFISEADYPSFWDSISKLDNLPYTTIEFDFSNSSDEIKVFEVKNSKIEVRGDTAIMSIFRDITERRFNEKKIMNAVIQAEEKERSRLAKELHDGLGPVMATLKMYLEWLNDQNRISDHPDIVNLSLNSINEAITTLKNISNNLSPHILEKFGLISALTSFIEKVKKVLPLNFILSFNVKDRFAVAAEMSIYRVLTECINNTVKHSGASTVRLELWSDDNTLNFYYSDDGKGFDIAKTEDLSTGMGLHNIRNRIKTQGGKILIHSKPGEGIKIESSVPLK